LIYETKGKVVGYKVLDTEGPNIEVTIVEKGILMEGIESSDTKTYWVIPRPLGAYYAERRGVFMIR
jgi:hypothetical protein